MREPAPKRLRPDSALFVDFDGTLVDIGTRPEAIVVAPGVVPLLASLHAKLGGALAVVSGRPIAELDHFLAPLQLPAAGIHGAERRSASGLLTRDAAADLSAIVIHLRALAANHPGLLVESKRGAVALHYRLAPECEALVLRTMESALAASPGMALLHGKMVVEMKPAGASKGRALAAFMTEPPFAGRRPVFVGDDLTDESGFLTAQTLGGNGIKVGPGPTGAQHRLDSPAALHAWLREASQAETRFA